MVVVDVGEGLVGCEGLFGGGGGCVGEDLGSEEGVGGLGGGVEERAGGGINFLDWDGRVCGEGGEVREGK